MFSVLVKVIGRDEQGVWASTLGVAVENEMLEKIVHLLDVRIEPQVVGGVEQDVRGYAMDGAELAVMLPRIRVGVEGASYLTRVMTTVEDSPNTLPCPTSVVLRARAAYPPRRPLLHAVSP